MAARIRVGTAAWSDHVDFYPPGVHGTDKIVFYARHFDVVEVNASYYAILPQRNYQRWAEQTPDDFRFNVKALANLTTHVRNEPATPEHFQAFRQSLQPLVDSGKLGALLFQFPPWFENTHANQTYIVHCVDQMDGLPVLVEFRNVTWLNEDAVDDTLSMLAGLGASHVAVDAPQTGTGTTRLVSAVTNADLAYLRLHGRNVDTWYQPSEVSGGRFNYNYSRQELELLELIALDMAENATELHIIFNNNVKGHGIQNAREIKRMLGLKVTEPPPRQARMDI
jgi:uncharacterized protein YecE (DUF72 family)